MFGLSASKSLTTCLKYGMLSADGHLCRNLISTGEPLAAGAAVAGAAVLPLAALEVSVEDPHAVKLAIKAMIQTQTSNNLAFLLFI
jgi:hypothetical protein